MMATVLTRLMPATPSRFIGRSTGRQSEATNSNAILANSRLDLDVVEDNEKADDMTVKENGEQEDPEEYIDEVQNGHRATSSSLTDENDEDRDSVTSRPKRKNKATKLGKARKRQRIVEDDEDDEDESLGEEADGQSSDASSSPEPEWHEEEEGEEQDETEVAEGNRCTFCKQLEDEDPSEEFELILTCVTCGENAHCQCAREADALASEEDGEDWKCPNCVDNGADPDERGSEKRRRRSSAPKIARDLLPAQRAVKVGSHSVFNTLILDDDPMDGSRSLRKRKISNEAEAHSSGQKSHRRGSSEVLIIESSDPKNLVDDATRHAATPLQEKSALSTDTNPRSRSGRLRQQRKPEKPLVSILENNAYRFVLSINLSPPKMFRLVEDLRKKKRRARDQARHERQAQVPTEVPFLEVSHYPAIQSASFTAPFFAFHGREGEESKSKPYGGILTEGEADNTKTFPQPLDRKKFETARLKAEDEWRRKLQAAAAEQARTSQKVVSGPPTRIKCINFGRYEIDTWHSAPYPEEYSRNRVLYICEFCLKYMNSDFVAWRHKLKCPARHPPGDEIYHDGAFSFFEVDGRKNPVYCQNLCLLAKLFLGSKTLYYDVEPFLFYIMTENNDEGCHFVGYFSKEKRPSSQNNVSCILVLPIHQRRGFGHMLIEFSYLLTRVEGKTGSPEKPLSDMGLVSYRNYWRRVLCSYLLNQREALSIADISDETGMTADDIVCGLEALRALVRDPVTKTYGLRLDYAYYRQYIEGYEKKGYSKINPDALTWVPYVMGRDNSHYENAPHIQTVAQRGDDSAISLPRMPEEGVQLATNGASEQDFSGSKSGGSVADIPTPLEDSDHHLHEALTTPFPWLDSNTSRQGSPAKLSQSAGNPSTPFANGDWLTDSPIPPTRFEVFPPLPGSATARKRVGRGRPRGPSRRGTPLRRRSPSGGTPQTAIRPSTIRRGRSKLAGMITEPGEDTDLTHDQAHDDTPVLTRGNSRSQEDAEGSPEADGEEVEMDV